jgi:hypothetical protein
VGWRALGNVCGRLKIVENVFGGRRSERFRGFFNRRIPLWEGHTRPGLEKPVDALNAGKGIARPLPPQSSLSWATWVKVSAHRLSARGSRRKWSKGARGTAGGKPATIQELARFLVTEANHCGVAKMLRRLSELTTTKGNSSDVEIDCRSEFWEGIRLGDFAAAESGFAEITHRRSYSRPKPPEKAISIIHKAKGLECDSVVVMPCDAKNFPDKPEARCLLYVAISRAKSRLMLVVSRRSPSPS